MTSIQPPAKILFTGANGYFATYAIKELLERGYHVIGTVRSAAKGEDLVQVHEKFGNRFGYAVVPDILKPGAFDTLIKGGNFDAVAHAASPVVASGNTPDDYIRPAVDGTVGILASIKQHGPTVRRVVFTSSALAAVQYQPGIVHNESHWNDAVIHVVEEKGVKASQGEIYSASKTHAEKAAWNFVEENKEEIKFDLVAVLPSYAPIHPVTSRDQLTSTNMIMSTVRKARPESDWGKTAYHFVHAHDMAILHALAFSSAEASGHRIFGIAAEPSWQDIYNALNDEPAYPNVPKGNPHSGTHPDTGSSSWDMSFSKKLLGRELLGTKQAFRETEEYYQKKGWAFD